jgi:phosphoribosyl-dephospho-CoA transferase
MQSADRNVKSGDKLNGWLVHDLFQISGFADLVDIGPEQCPAWVERSLQAAPFVVAHRAKLFNGLIPVGVRGPLRNQRFAAYLSVESVRQRITPEQLTGKRGWLADARTQQMPALRALAATMEALVNFSLAFGPTGSVGFELASGLPTVTATSDLDLLIRTPERLSMESGRKLMTLFSEHACRIDAQLETPRGALSLTEYASGQRPMLLRQSGGPVLVDDPWSTVE